jgi:oxygen-independent coproporphyrinogen-3 oxidase
MNGNLKRGIYIHVPFCSKKCPYCHFYVVKSESKDEKRYIDAIIKEWESKLQGVDPSSLITLYIGGGTPTELSDDGLCRLVSYFTSRYPQLQEVTVEANPESVTLQQMQKLYQAGANRISLGVQSLVDHDLTLLKRQHRASKAIDAIACCSAAGLTNLSIDLMYDLPHQSLASFEKTLEAIGDLPITHLSLYNLVIEDKTAFKRIERQLKKTMPDDQLSLELYTLAKAKLQALGFEQYEISAFSKPGYRSLHNSGYWESRPFFGLGPSSFSDDGKRRYQNIPHLQRYYEKVENGIDPCDFDETLDPEKRFMERLLVRLRLLDPLPLSTFIADQGHPPQDLPQKLENAINQGLLTSHHDHIALTHQGVLFYDELAAKLL